MKKDTLNPPIAKIKSKELTLHGHTRIDNYYWLREKTNPDVIAHLEAENAYTQAMMAHTTNLQETLYKEMVGRIQETDSTAPYKKRDYYYYSRTEAGKQYKIHCRKLGSMDAEEEIILDENVLAEGNDYFKLGVAEISPNQHLLAYSTDTSGGEKYTVFVKDLRTGDLFSDQIENTFYFLEWANDNQTLFYTINDDAWRSYKLFRHTLGTDVSSDVELFHEADELFGIYLGKTKDDAYLLMLVESIETSEWYYLDANQPLADFTLFRARQQDMLYQLDHRQGEFFILTNDQAQNFRMLKTAVSTPDQSNWQEIIPHNSDKLLESFDLFDGHMVVYGRSQGLQTIDIHNFTNGEDHTVIFPEPVYATKRKLNPESNSTKVEFVYTSLTTADSTYSYDMDSRDWTLIKQDPVLGGYDPANYETEWVFAIAEDGVQVPMSIVYRKGMVRDGNTPCLLYGYGSYGASTSPAFDQKRLSLIDRGFIFAIAHIRGGQEMGRHWYDDGKFLNKRNTFTDFIACAKHLIAEKYTSAEKLAVNGRSAGGLLMGGITTMAPELFKVVVAGVPFVDVVTTMLDTSIPLTTGEWEEWGNPNDEEYYHYMLSYSPYDNTTAQAYPNILITAGLNDPRVQYWEPAKWTAKLRAVKTDDNILLSKTIMGAGHFASSGRYDYLKDVAFEYAFILDIFGIKE